MKLSHRPRLGACMLGLAALAAPAPAFAAEAPQNGLPQMDFADPLTFIQILWMAVIMIVLYLLLSRWTLPRIGRVIEARATRIEADLEAARRAKAEAEAAIETVNRSIRQARETAQATIARAMDAAKAEARAQAEQLNERLDAQLAASEAQIDEAREKAMSSLLPVAEDLTADLVRRLTGSVPDGSTLHRVLASLGDGSRSFETRAASLEAAR